RSGAREGPSAIRTASRLVRPYNMFADVYPFRVLDLVDYGDIDPVPGYTEDTFQRIQGGLEPLFRASVVPFVAGGDHSITLPILRAYRAARSEGVHSPPRMSTPKDTSTSWTGSCARWRTHRSTSRWTSTCWTPPTHRGPGRRSPEGSRAGRWSTSSANSIAPTSWDSIWSRSH